MATKQRRTEFEIALLEAFNTIHANVYGWVVLSNHYHVLAQIKSVDDVSRQLYLEDYGREWLKNTWYQFKPGNEFGKKWGDFNND